MGWWFGRKAAPAARPFVPVWLQGEGEEGGFVRGYRSQLDEVYRRNPVGLRAVRLVAGLTGSLPLFARDGPENAVQLVQEGGLLEQITAALLLHGNAYVRLITDGHVKPAELHLLKPERVSISTGADGWGANLATLGNELIQFGRAEPMSGGGIRLSKLLRGRRGTEWAASTHSIGEPFLLIEPSTVRSLDLPASAVRALVQCTSHGVGDVAPLPQIHRTVTGEAMRPPSPCHLTIRLFGQQLQLKWVWRSHLSWEWTNGLEVPADDFPERYRLRLTGPGGQLVADCTRPDASFDIDQIPAESGETIRAFVATFGPSAVSREARAEFIL